MGEARLIEYDARFWPENPYPKIVKAWPFKTNHVRGEGVYSSFQKIPSGVTLRFVVSGDWLVSMRGRSSKCVPGQVFCAMPSESLEFRQLDADAAWEWRELQFNGPEAESLLAEFGFSATRSALAPAKPERALELFVAMHSFMESEDRGAAAMLSMSFALLDSFGRRNEASACDASSRASLVKLARLLLESEEWTGKGVEQLSQRLGVERSTLYRAFKAETGLSPHEYIDKMRLLKAEDLLCGARLPVAQVAAAAGFPDVKYFIGWFKARRGKPPGAWRDEMSSR